MKEYNFNAAIGRLIKTDLESREGDRTDIFSTIYTRSGYYEYQAQITDSDKSGGWVLIDLAYIPNDKYAPAIIAPTDDMREIERYINA